MFTLVHPFRGIIGTASSQRDGLSQVLIPAAAVLDHQLGEGQQQAVMEKQQ